MTKNTQEESTETPIEDLPPVPDPADAPPQPLNAVIIVKVVGEDGSVDVEIAPNGDVNALEIATLLALGKKKWAAQLGLD